MPGRSVPAGLLLVEVAEAEVEDGVVLSDGEEEIGVEDADVAASLDGIDDVSLDGTDDGSLKEIDDISLDREGGGADENSGIEDTLAGVD